jgi:hypothetical protein
MSFAPCYKQQASRRPVTSDKGTVSTNVADYNKKDLQTAFANASVTTYKTSRHNERCPA